MTQWNRAGIQVAVFHPHSDKKHSFTQKYELAKAVSLDDFHRFSTVILAIPPGAVSEFINEHEYHFLKATTFINMATAQDTEEIQQKFPQLSIVAMKLMGNAADLELRGNGLFVTEQPVNQPVNHLFSAIGNIVIDEEQTVSNGNKLATYYALKMATELEAEAKFQNIDPIYVERMLTSLAPEVIRAYAQEELGGFGKKVLETLRLEDS